MDKRSSSLVSRFTISVKQKKQELLEQCLTAAIEVGVFDASINAIAQRIVTSGRMLVYHFGSKQKLDRQMIGLLEIRLREKLWTFHSVAVEGDAVTTPLLAMWLHLTSPEMNGLLKLTMELHQRAIQGDLETKDFLKRESQKWVDSLSMLTNDRAIGLALFYLFQGAILDFLTTGNSQRGQTAIAAFVKMIE